MALAPGTHPSRANLPACSLYSEHVELRYATADTVITVFTTCLQRTLSAFSFSDPTSAQCAPRSLILVKTKDAGIVLSALEQCVRSTPSLWHVPPLATPPLRGIPYLVYVRASCSACRSLMTPSSLCQAVLAVLTLPDDWVMSPTNVCASRGCLGWLHPAPPGPVAPMPRDCEAVTLNELVQLLQLSPFLHARCPSLRNAPRPVAPSAPLVLGPTSVEEVPPLLTLLRAIGVAGSGSPLSALLNQGLNRPASQPLLRRSREFFHLLLTLRTTQPSPHPQSQEDHRERSLQPSYNW